MAKAEDKKSGNKKTSHEPKAAPENKDKIPAKELDEAEKERAKKELEERIDKLNETNRKDISGRR